MINKYLNMDPVPWLTDGNNPAVSYLVKNEILKQQDSEKIYEELVKSDLTNYFKNNVSKGILGDFTHLDLFYRGSVWFFLLAVESGYKYNSEFVSSTADKICSKTQLAEGGFKFNFKSSEAVGCRSGNLIYALLKSGIDDNRTKNGINWIIQNQREDGGWLHCPVAGFCDIMKIILLNKSGNGLKHEKEHTIPSCPIASYSCLNAIIQSDNKTFNETIDKGADFFIRNNFFIKTNKKMQCGINVDFEKLGYPVMSQYDYLSGLILISKTGKYNCFKNGELFNRIIKKQNLDGSWNIENRFQGMMNEKSGRSRWTTMNVLRLLNKVVEQENQLEKA